MKSMILNKEEINDIFHNFKNVKFVYNATFGDYCIVNIDDYLAFVSLNDKQIKCKSFCGELKNYDDFADCVIDLKVHNCFKIKGYDSKYTLYNLQLKKVSDRRFNSLFEEGQHIVGFYGTNVCDSDLFSVNKFGISYFDQNGNTSIENIQHGVVRVSESGQIAIILCGGIGDYTIYNDNLEVFMRCSDYDIISDEKLWIMNDEHVWYLYNYDGSRFDITETNEILGTYGEDSETCSLIQSKSGKLALVKINEGRIIFVFDKFKYDENKSLAVLVKNGVVYVTDFCSYDVAGEIDITEYVKDVELFSQNEISYIEDAIKNNEYDYIR